MADEISSPLLLDPPAPAPAVPRRRHWAVQLSMVAVALALGAASSIACLLAMGWRPPVQRHYAVTVYLKSEVTEAQKAAVETGLREMGPVSGVDFQTREEAFASVKKLWPGDPAGISGMSVDTMPESFRAMVIRTEFDCDTVTPLRALAGVSSVAVIQPPTDTRPGAKIAC